MTSTPREPNETTNLDSYGLPPVPWSRAQSALAEAPSRPELTYFLGTVCRDCQPHAAGIGAVYVSGDLYFTSGPNTRKSRNLATNLACTISAHLATIDLVIYGEATRVTDPAIVERLAAVYRGGGWPAEAAGDALTAPFSAPSAGPPPWHLYRLRIKTLVGVATSEPYGATRWRFSTE
jgi:hypothetical protein